VTEPIGLLRASLNERILPRPEIRPKESHAARLNQRSPQSERPLICKIACNKGSDSPFGTLTISHPSNRLDFFCEQSGSVAARSP
jgi:hypothetical protein